MPSIEMYESIGFFDGPTIAAHVVWPTKEEIPILVERQVGVIHNPTSNMKIASGIAPITEMLDAGEVKAGVEFKLMVVWFHMRTEFVKGFIVLFLF